jgi:two-component system OmpR family sensor kinase/two-component system sensor histidine kinase BaeS
MMPHRRYRHTPPPWWPDNERWPPVSDRDFAPIRRRFFLYRAGAVLIFALVFGAIGLARFLSAFAAGAGLSIPPPLISVAILALVFGVVFLFLGGMRRVGMPMSDIVEAADRVGSGDFSTRLIERGPPFLRSVARAFNTMTARLERQEKLRRDLMADVAHELRTPLSVMRGRLEGLVDGVYQRDDATLVQLVEETKHLERLVEDLRTLAHAEGGTLKLQRESTDPGVLLQDVVRSFAARAEANGIELTAATPADLPLVDIDPVRIREVIANLLANALRHTPRGGRVTVSAELAANRLRVAVQDTGSGIASEQLPKIFDRFAKGVDSTGSGLGLAIARNLVMAHGGEINAESVVAQGTTITFTLPL